MFIKAVLEGHANNVPGFAFAPARPRRTFLDTATAAHFLSVVGLLFEVGLECALSLTGVLSIGFSRETVSNRKQKVSWVTGLAVAEAVEYACRVK